MLGGGSQRNAVELLGFQGNRAGPYPKLSQSEVRGLHSPTGPGRMPAGEEQGLGPPPPRGLVPRTLLTTPLSSAGRRSQADNRRQRQATGHSTTNYFP